MSKNKEKRVTNNKPLTSLTGIERETRSICSPEATDGPLQC